MASQQFVAFRPITTGGLLTTVADLPVSLKRQYTVLTETPLDLSVKPTLDAITPPSTPSPPKKRYREIEVKLEPKASDGEEVNQEKTPKSRPKSSASRSTVKSGGEHKRTKAVRKLKFDEDTSSPVSGTIIRPFEEIDEHGEDQIGDIDPQYNIVEVTEEAKAEIAAIPNVIGAYRCRLCRSEFEDAFGLARHRCSCIVLLEYRCPECGKRFNCPANLASHRRWHKPKEQLVSKRQDTAAGGESENQFPCSECGKFFKRMAYLRKHMATHTKKDRVVSHSSRSSDSFSDPSRATEERQNITEMIFSYTMRNTPSTTSSSASERSTPSPRIQIIDDAFTEEENLAAAALAHLRNGPSVIRHTTALVV